MKKDEKVKKHIKNKYYKDDKKVISLHIDEEKDLYNSLDASNETLSYDVTRYLEANAETLLPLSDIVIEVDCNKKIDIVQFEKCLKLHYGIETLNSKRIDKIARKKKMFLLFSFILAFTISFFTTDAVSNIFTFIGTLAIWEFSDSIVFFEEKNLIEEFVYEVLENAKVTQK